MFTFSFLSRFLNVKSKQLILEVFNFSSKNEKSEEKVKKSDGRDQVLRVPVGSGRARHRGCDGPKLGGGRPGTHRRPQLHFK